MKHLLLFLCAFLTACNTPATVTVGDVTIKSSGRAGGQGLIYAEHGKTKVLIADNNEDSFREINKTARFGLGVSGAVDLAGIGANAWKSVSNTKTAAGVSTAAGQETTKQAGIAADVAKSKIAAESPAP